MVTDVSGASLASALHSMTVAGGLLFVACAFSVGLAGIDLVLEGEAARVTDRPAAPASAGRYREGGWPAEVEGEAFTAPFSAPAPDRRRGTRWRFDADGRSLRPSSLVVLIHPRVARSGA